MAIKIEFISFLETTKEQIFNKRVKDEELTYSLSLFKDEVLSLEKEDEFYFEDNILVTSQGYYTCLKEEVETYNNV